MYNDRIQETHIHSRRLPGVKSIGMYL